MYDESERIDGEYDKVHVSTLLWLVAEVFVHSISAYCVRVVMIRFTLRWKVLFPTLLHHLFVALDLLFHFMV